MKKGLLTGFILFLFTTAVWAEPARPTFYVIGVKNHVKGKEWQDMGIGFGISNLIAQYVYDTGEFIPIEEKGEIKKAIRENREFYWRFKGKVKESDIQKKAEEIEVDFVFLGEVKKCKKYRKKAFIGFVSKYQTTVRVFFTLHMINKKTGEKKTVKGEGYSTKGATGFVFEAIDGEIKFNSTMVGLAIEEAVKNSVDNLW